VCVLCEGAAVAAAAGKGGGGYRLYWLLAREENASRDPTLVRACAAAMKMGTFVRRRPSTGATRKNMPTYCFRAFSRDSRYFAVWAGRAGMALTKKRPS
jgi:hypothetical protein